MTDVSSVIARAEARSNLFALWGCYYHHPILPLRGMENIPFKQRDEKGLKLKSNLKKDENKLGR